MRASTRELRSTRIRTSRACAAMRGSQKFAPTDGDSCRGGLTDRGRPPTMRSMQQQGGGYPALEIVAVDPGTISRPVPRAHWAHAFEGGSDYHGTTCAGRVPVTLDRIFGWFEPGSSDFRSAGFEGRSILWDVH